MCCCSTSLARQPLLLLLHLLYITLIRLLPHLPVLHVHLHQLLSLLLALREGVASGLPLLQPLVHRLHFHEAVHCNIDVVDILREEGGRRRGVWVVG